MTRGATSPPDEIGDESTVAAETDSAPVRQPPRFRASRRWAATAVFMLVGAVGALGLSVHHVGHRQTGTPSQSEPASPAATEIPPTPAHPVPPEPPKSTPKEPSVSLPQPARVSETRTKPDAPVPLPPPASRSLPAATPPVARMPVPPAPRFKRPHSPIDDQVARAIRDGINYLKSKQRADGSWEDFFAHSPTLTTSWVTQELLTAGEKVDSPSVRRAITYLRQFGPADLRSPVAVASQTIVFLVAEPARDRDRILVNVDWLQRAQIRPEQGINRPGSWASTFDLGTKPGDMDSTSTVINCLSAARRKGFIVNPDVWVLASRYWAASQEENGNWSYDLAPGKSNVQGTIVAVHNLMTCLKLAQPLVTLPRGTRPFPGPETLASDADAAVNCGREAPHPAVQAGMEWLSRNLEAGPNLPMSTSGRMSSLCYLGALSHLTGKRSVGPRHVYRTGVEALLGSQHKPQGFWQPVGTDSEMQSCELVETGFALGFLTGARVPVLISKLEHPPVSDWNDDPDDIRILVDSVARERKTPLGWQAVDPSDAPLADLLQAPVAFLNGHKAPELGAAARKNLRAYVDQGGVLLADACCSSADFDSGFKQLMKELFPEKEESRLQLLARDHPVWTAKHHLKPGAHPLWGVERGGRTIVVYSPKDLSCCWNQAERFPADPRVTLALMIGQNIIELVTRQNRDPDVKPLPGPVLGSRERESPPDPSRVKPRSSENPGRQSRFRG